MITMIVHNLHTGSSKRYDFEKLYDFDKVVSDYGPVINSIVGDVKNLRTAVDQVAEYLSNHHLSAEVVDPEDAEEIYDPNVETFTESDKKPEKALDLKDVLESYNEVEHIDVPDMHVLDSSTHRWNK